MSANSREKLSQIILMGGIAGVLWFFTFAVDFLNFWLKIAVSAGFLAITSLLLTKPEKSEYKITSKQVLIGVFSAILLYGVFYVGNFIAGLIFDFSADQVGAIYAKRQNTHRLIIALILLLITSPAEEIFWRGFLQKKIMARYSDFWGWIWGTLIYGLVHVWSLNFMLVGAALVAGAFWGLLYMRYRNVTLLIISHALWTVGVFVLFPIT